MGATRYSSTAQQSRLTETTLRQALHHLPRGNRYFYPNGARDTTRECQHTPVVNFGT